FWLARAWGLPRSAAVLAGLVFTLGSFLQAQVHHENITRTAAWLPVLLAFVELALRSPAWPRRAAWMVCASAALGMAGLGLHSQMLAIELLVLAAYGAMRWWVGPLPPWSSQSAALRRLGNVIVVCLPVLILGLALAGAQLAPLLELARFSPRGSGIPYAEAAQYSLTPYGLLQLVFPFLFRGPDNQQWGLWTHWESYLYVGLVPLVLALVAVACVRRREVAAWAVLAAGGTVVALGQYSLPNLHYLVWLLPGLSGLRAPGRFTIVTVLGLAMLAGFGLSWLQQQSLAASGLPPRRRVRTAVQVLAVCAVSLPPALLLGHFAVLTWPAEVQSLIDVAYLALPRDSYPLLAADVWSGLAWATDLANPRVAGAVGGLLLISAVLALWQVSPWQTLRCWRGWPHVLVVLAAGDLLVFAWSVHPRGSIDRLSTPPAVVGVLQRLGDPVTGGGRVLTSPVLSQLSADRLAPFGVQDAGGYSSLQFAWHRDFLNRVVEVDDDLLDLWNVRYLVEPARFGPLPQYRDVDFLPSRALLYARAGNATANQVFNLAPGTDVTEIRVVAAMIGALDVKQDEAVAELDLYGPGGDVLARSYLLAGRHVMEWASHLPSVSPYVRHQRVELAGLTFQGNESRLLSFAAVRPLADGPVAATRLGIRAVLPKGDLVILGAAVVDARGGVQQLFGPSKSKYRVVYVDRQVRVLENTAALPRAFV
ncbi:MAG: hypothetical protein M3336_08820, partial [Chloroflexota bacterium]|nr:hypothetical protein [Chloroflexota bacterium]